MYRCFVDVDLTFTPHLSFSEVFTSFLGITRLFFGKLAMMHGVCSIKISSMKPRLLKIGLKLENLNS